MLNYQFLERDYLMHTGRIVYKNSDGIYVKVGDGILVIKEVQEAHSGLIFNPASDLLLALESDKKEIKKIERKDINHT